MKYHTYFPPRYTDGTVWKLLHNCPDLWCDIMVSSWNRHQAAWVRKCACHYYMCVHTVDKALLCCFSHRPALLAAAENFTVLIKNSVTYPKFNVHRSVFLNVKQRWERLNLISAVYANILFYRVPLYQACILLPPPEETYCHILTPHIWRGVSSTVQQTRTVPYSASKTLLLRLERTSRTWLWRYTENLTLTVVRSHTSGQNATLYKTKMWIKSLVFRGFSCFQRVASSVLLLTGAVTWTCGQGHVTPSTPSAGWTTKILSIMWLLDLTSGEAIFDSALLINWMKMAKLVKQTLLAGSPNTTRPQMEKRLEPWSKHSGSGLTSLFMEPWGLNQCCDCNDFIKMCVITLRWY